jgi:hypothetical protein
MLTGGDAQGFDSKAFEARFPGRDPACGERIEVGDRVMYVGTVLVHEACAADAPAGQSDKPTKFEGTTLEDMGY